MSIKGLLGKAHKDLFFLSFVSRVQLLTAEKYQTGGLS